jgi:hypothetical protein
MAKLFFGLNQSLDGYVDYWNLRQVPRSFVTSTSKCETWPAVCAVAACTR